MPIDPEWFPETALLIAGVIVAGLAIRFLLLRRARAALGSFLAAAALITVAVVLGRSPQTHESNRARVPPPPPVKAILPVSPSSPPVAQDEPDTIPSTSLLLGGVEIRVVPSDHYSLAVDGRRFLILDSRGTEGLLVSGDVGYPQGGLAVRLMRNRSLPPTMPLERPDNNTLLLRRGDQNLMRIHFVDPRRIEVLGRFHPLGQAAPVEITPTGIRWPGGGAAAGTMVDLRHFGKGTVDFRRSGKIRILRR